MGNKTVTPLATNNNPNTFDFAYNSENSRVHSKSPIPNMPNDPLISTPVTNLDTSAPLIKSPIPSTTTIPRTSVSHVPTKPHTPIIPNSPVHISSPVTNLDTFTHPSQFDNTAKHTSFYVLNTQASPVPTEPHAPSISSPVTNLDTFTPPPYTNTVKRTSVYVLNTQASPVPTEPRPPSISSPVTNLDTFTHPPQFNNTVIRTSVYVLNTQTSPALAEPHAPSISAPVTNLDTFTPPPYTNTVKRTSVYVLNTQASRVSMKPSTPIISTPGKTLATSPINSPIPTISGNSITSTSPTNIHNNTAPQKSPMASNTLISTVPTTLTTVDNSVIRKIPVTSPVPSIDNIYIGPYNSSPILSPDTSAVSPTFDTPPFPIPPTSTITGNPVKSNATETISKTPFPYNVNAKRTPSNISLSSSAPISEQVKSSNLSSVQRWNKIQQRQKEHSHTISQTPNLVTSPSSSSRTNTNDISKETSAILKIIPVPSFSLRSTAVCSFSIDEHLLSERTQSIHKDISIFKYYLTQKEIKRTLGNHTNATMFQMNTQLKQTPLPNPSLSFLHKNFNDGIHETDDNSSVTATFSSLGLQNDLETESADPPTTELHSNEKQQQQKNSFPVVSSNNSTSEKPLVSILKKPTHPPIDKPIPTQIDKKNDFENYSTISFNFQTTPKANQSISRSEKLFSS
ncbi:unnamed protein product [Adineta steineri]|uniref:Uncharacterized protein n=1 Tax=Adineta steineri TaxID=433720 RepID=A0A814UTL0_9BILA|nr:unnamed protein product [Adineta steineri]CAF3586541.1 unnamed protein product [Adineta steineri]